MPWRLEPDSPRVEQIDFSEGDAPEEWTKPQVPVPQQYWPLRFRQYSKQDRFRDFMGGPFSRTYLVSRAVRDLMEELEPGAQHFVPLELERHTGEIVPAGEFFLLKIMQVVDAVVPELSEVQQHMSRRTGLLLAYDHGGDALVVFRRDVVGDKHVWCDRYLKDEFYCSDAFLAEVEARGMGAFEKVRAGLSDAPAKAPGAAAR